MLHHMKRYTLANRLANAEEFQGFADRDRLRPPSPPPSRSFAPQDLLRQATFAAFRATGIVKAFQEASEEMQTKQTEQAANKILIVRDVPYVDRPVSTKQSCDIYLPKHSEKTDRPLIVHFHGGGWVRGDRRDEFRGAPAVARAHAANGCVVVTPSYRLGSSEDHMADAQMAVLWAREHAKDLGADPERLYLSGHSAGGNIATLLAIGPWLAQAGLPADAVKGVIGISGVYTVKNPLGGPLNGVKNKIYDRLYRNRVFGDEISTLAQHSPTALLRLAAGKSEPFKKPACAVFADAVKKWAGTDDEENKYPPASAVPVKTNPAVGCSTKRLPPVMLINASWDLGLEDDATYFARLLESSTGTKPEHHIVPGTNHTTVSWSEDAFTHCRDFIAKCEASRGSGTAAAA